MHSLHNGERVVALERTIFGHFDWLRAHKTTAEQDKKIIATIPAHYAVLMHDQVLLPQPAHKAPAGAAGDVRTETFGDLS